MIKNKEELLQVRESAREQVAAYDCRILVCSGTGCIATGSMKIYEEFLTLTKDAQVSCLTLRLMTKGNMNMWA